MKQLKLPKWTVSVILLAIGVYGVIALYILRGFMVWVIMEVHLPEDIPSELRSSSEDFNTAVLGVMPFFLAVILLTLRNLYRMARRHDNNIEDG